MLSPIKVQGGGENPLNLPQTVEVLTTKLNRLSKKVDNTNRTVMNLETHLDHLTRQDEYINSRLNHFLPPVQLVFLLLAILFDRMWAIELEHY
jgi:uncharacterized protein YoxC